MKNLTGGPLESLADLFHRQFCSAYDAELRQLDLLPQLASAAGEPQLARLFDQHHSQTRLQAERLKAMASTIEMPLERGRCQAMEGLIADALLAAEAMGSEKVRDAALIVAAQGVEHYEISAYGCLRTFAERLGLSELQKQLQEILEEESAADDELSELAENFINTHAARESL